MGFFSWLTHGLHPHPVWQALEDLPLLPTLGAGSLVFTDWSKVRAVGRSIPPPWGSVRFRPPTCTYAPRGCIVRVVERAKSRKIPTRKLLPLLSFLWAGHVVKFCAGAVVHRADEARPAVLPPVPGRHVRGGGPRLLPVVVLCTRREPVNFTPTGFNPISPAHPHVHPVGRTRVGERAKPRRCPPEKYYRVFWVGRSWCRRTTRSRRRRRGAAATPPPCQRPWGTCPVSRT